MLLARFGPRRRGQLSSVESRDCLVSEVCHDKVEDSNVLSDNASTNRLALAFTSTTLSVCLLSLLTQQTNTSVGQDTLTHQETLLVVTS
jgi:hypothetical protein